MQNNVTELTQKLLRSLDSNYNVIDMPAVTEIISQLENVTITKELLETTRLGKHVNQLRRNTTNESLAKRAKELVKKWRDMVLPDSNGQIKPAVAIQNDSHHHHHHHHSPEEVLSNKKRPAAKEPLLDSLNAKRTRVNGQMSELDFSDNSNSSFKDAITAKAAAAVQNKPPVVINSDSNSSMPESRQEPLLEQQQPKKRGRKKGSKNHKNLIEEAETSFSNKLNVSRGNAKVKTTQELLADLHIRNSNNAVSPAGSGKPIEDLNERAAKLTERVSIIDQKLNANSNRYRNSQKKLHFKNSLIDKSEVIESGTVSNVKSERRNFDSHRDDVGVDDEIIIVDDMEPSDGTEDLKGKAAVPPPLSEPELNVPKSLTVEEALALLPPVDPSVLEEPDPDPHCACQLVENKTDFSVEDNDEEVNLQHTFEFVETDDCPAKAHLADKYHLDSETLDERVQRLQAERIPNVNGNFGVGVCKEGPRLTDDGLYANVVPNVALENIPKFSSIIDYVQPASENFKKYSISEGKTERCCEEEDDKDEEGEEEKADNKSGSSSSSNRCCTLQGVAKNCTSGSVEDDDCGIVVATVQNGNSDSSNDRVSDTRTFCEWHEVLETPSYGGEILKILPYVIID